MKKTLRSGMLLIFVSLWTISAQVTAADCGEFKGNKIVTYGGLSCSRAKDIYRAFQDGHIPQGWVCGLSAGGCNRANQGFTFRFN